MCFSTGSVSLLVLFLMFILSRIVVLTLPISVFVGFMSLHVGLFLKLGLWFLRVMNACFMLVMLILSSSPSLVAMFLSPLWMSSSSVVGAFL